MNLLIVLMKCCKCLQVINEKLILLCELMDQLNDYLKDKHHIRLEWMIIILIMIEVSYVKQQIIHLRSYVTNY